MSELIDRQSLLDNLNRFAPEKYNALVNDLIMKEPAVQPEIIRCKDCKYCDRGIDEDGNPFLKCLGWVYGGTQGEDFCSHAERRTDE